MDQYYKNNKKIIEGILDKVLKQICRSVDLSLEEWDDFEELYKLVRNHHRFSKLGNLADLYDKQYMIAEQMKVRIDPKYSWFKNLLKNKYGIK